jgi:hypothetical protein
LSDPHADDLFWRTVRSTFERMEKDAPTGYAPRVEVHVLGEVIVPAVGWPAPPWLFFETLEEEPSRGRRVVAVHPEHIAKVEIRFVRRDGKQPPGFRFEPERDA